MLLKIKHNQINQTHKMVITNNNNNNNSNNNKYNHYQLMQAGHNYQICHYLNYQIYKYRYKKIINNNQPSVKMIIL